jgi:hypothetical protein
MIAFLLVQVVLLVLEVHARIAEEPHHFHHLVSYLIRTFHSNHVLLEKYVKFKISIFKADSAILIIYSYLLVRMHDSIFGEHIRK